MVTESDERPDGERLTLGEVPDVARFAGLSETHAGAFRMLAARAVDLGRSPRDPAHVLVVPGRIEALGKHTDYAGGRSLTCATEQGICVLALPRTDSTLAIDDPGCAERHACEIDAALEPADGGWSLYARTVARRLALDFGGPEEPELRGADVVLSSDLPLAAGMSSSSALVVGLFAALAAVNRLADRPRYRRAIGEPEALASYLGAVESGGAFGPFAGDRGVGTSGGSEDHTAIVCSAPGRIGQYLYSPVRLERSIEVPEGHVFAVASSGVRARKAGDRREAYNRLSSDAAALAGIWRTTTGGGEADLGAILAGPDDAFGRLREAVVSGTPERHERERLLERLEHFRAESEQLVPQAGDALERGDLGVFGLAADRSQYLAARLLGNQTAETAALAESARELGAVAASSFGAGFGGAVWALVEEGAADELAEAWLAHYLEAFPEREDAALVLVTEAAPPLRRLGR